MTYRVEIVETLSRAVEVRAAGAEDAERLVRDRYRAGEIVLGGDDCVERSIKAIEEAIRIYNTRRLHEKCGCKTPKVFRDEFMRKAA